MGGGGKWRRRESCGHDGGRGRGEEAKEARCQGRELIKGRSEAGGEGCKGSYRCRNRANRTMV